MADIKMQADPDNYAEDLDLKAIIRDKVVECISMFENGEIPYNQFSIVQQVFNNLYTKYKGVNWEIVLEVVNEVQDENLRLAIEERLNEGKSVQGEG